MKSIIILIGPMSAGKSTLAKLLAKRLKVKRIELDDVRQKFYSEIGYNEGFASRIVGEEGMTGLIKYWQPFEAHAVERALQEYDNCVLDFGAGHSVYRDQELFSRVEKVLQPIKHVILILPSPDLERSTEIVNQRFSDFLIKEVGKVDSELLQLNYHFVHDPSNQLLAKKTFYTDSKTPAEVCQEILDWVQSNGNDDFTPRYSQLEMF